MIEDIDALSAEIIGDPEGIGYRIGVTWKADRVIADLLNDPANGALVWRRSIDMRDVYSAVDWDEFFTLADGKQRAFVIITSTASLNTDSVNIQDAFVGIFPAGPTLTALIALAHVQGSRAEVLFGEGTAATPNDVAEAANV